MPLDGASLVSSATTPPPKPWKRRLLSSSASTYQAARESTRYSPFQRPSFELSALASRFLPGPVLAWRAMVLAEGQQSHQPGPFDGCGETSLMLGAYARFAPSLHLVPVRDVPSDLVDLFVVNIFYVVNAKGTQFPSGVIPGPATWPSNGWPSTCCRHTLHLLF